MATITKLTSSNAYYGYEKWSNSAATHIYVGGDTSTTKYNYRSRATFPSLYKQLDIADSRIAITAMTLYVYRNSGGATTVSVGCSDGGGWDDGLAATASGRVGAADGWYAIDISALAPQVETYQGNWFIHLSASTPRVRLNGTGMKTKPYIEVAWEYAAATITGDKDSVELGDAVTFTVAPEIDGETHTLTYSLGDAGGTIAENAGNEITWTPPESLATEIIDSDTANVQIRMTVYNPDGSVNRTEVYYQTVTVPASVKPKVTGVGSLKSGLSGYGLSGRSRISLSPTISMEAAYGAELVSVDAVVSDGQSVRWTAVSESEPGIFTCAAVLTDVISLTGTVTITVTAADSRGRTAVGSKSYTFCDYALPEITSFSVFRYGPYYDENEEVIGYIPSDLGENIAVELMAEASKVAPAGTQLNMLQYTITGTNVQTGETITGAAVDGVFEDEDGYAADSGRKIMILFEQNIFPGTFGGDEAWNFTVTVTDSAGGRATGYSAIAEAHAAASVSPDKRGFAVGMLASGTKDNPKFEVAKGYQAHFYGGIWGADGRRLDRAQLFPLTAPDGGGVQLFDISSRNKPEIEVDNAGWISVSYDNTAGTGYGYVTIYTPTSDRIVEAQTYTAVLEIKSITKGNVIAVHNSTSSSIGQFITRFEASSVGVHTHQVVARDSFASSTTMIRTLFQMPAGESGSAVFRISVLEDLTITEDNFIYTGYMNGNFAAYSDALAPRITRIGPTVYLDGFVKNLSDLALTSSGEILLHLGEPFRPAVDVSVLQQGSGGYLWWLRIQANGDIVVSRYRQGDSYIDAATGSQFPLTARWIAADAYY